MPSAPIPASQTAWNHFADELKRIGEKITGVTGARTDRERAEGYRYLIRLISVAQELEMEVDRRHPNLARMMTPIRKYKGDGTDTLYHEAKLDETLEYEFEVTRGDDIFFSATVYAHDDHECYYIIDHLIDDEIVWTERNGRPYAKFHLSAERPEAVDNWIGLAESRPIMCLRQYFPDFVQGADTGVFTPAVFDIRCISDVEVPGVYGDEDLEAGLKRVIDFIDDAVDVPLGLSIYAGLNAIEYDDTGGGREFAPVEITDAQMKRDQPTHEDYSPEELAAMIDPKLVSHNLPGPGIQYLGAWFTLADDEAIKITGRDVPCRYWSCQILTRYLESGDYRFFSVGLNNRAVKLASDGSFVIYASPQNPGVENWLCTQGYRNGHIVMRTLLADPLMEASFSVVKLDDVPGKRV